MKKKKAEMKIGPAENIWFWAQNAKLTPCTLFRKAWVTFMWPLFDEKNVKICPHYEISIFDQKMLN